MKVGCAEPEDEEETAACADDACGAAVAQRMVVGSLAVEVESLGANGTDWSARWDHLG